MGSSNLNRRRRVVARARVAVGVHRCLSASRPPAGRPHARGGHHRARVPPEQKFTWGRAPPRVADPSTP
jgi:hypothetical protein